MAEPRLEEEYLVPYQSWQQAPTPETAGALLHALDPAIRRAVQQHGPAAGPVLHVQARKLVLDALPRYDPHKSGLGTFLRHQLQGLHRLAQQRTQVLRVPERVALERQYLHRGTEELREQLGRDPSDLELSDHLHLPLRRLARLRQAAPPVLAEGAVLSQLGSEDGASDPAVRSQDDDPWLDFVYRSLEPRDQLILDHTLGRHGRESLSNQLLARRLGVTPAAISQRKAKIQQLLNERDQLNVL